MKKSELVKLLVNTAGVSQVEAGKRIAYIDEIMELAVKELEVGDKVKIGDYLVVEKKVQPARLARNPRTGENMEIPEKTVIKVKSSAAIKKL